MQNTTVQSQHTVGLLESK